MTASSRAEYPPLTGRFHMRLLWPTVLTCSVLVGISAVMAISLFREQNAVGQALQERIERNRNAADLEQNLLDLISVLEDRVEEVGGLNARLSDHVQSLRPNADRPEETVLIDELGLSVAKYRELWATLPPKSSADHIPAVRQAVMELKDTALPRCQELRRHTRARLDQSYQEHRQSLRQLAWGMVAVGGLGGIAGIVLGFGVARGVRRSIHRLQVRVMDAAGKIGQPVSEIVFMNEGMLGRTL